MSNQMKKPNTQPRDSVDRAYDTVIRPVVKAADRWGYVTELTKQFNLLTGRNTHRNVVDTWITRDLKKRVHPNYGTTLKLIQAALIVDEAMRKRRP